MRDPVFGKGDCDECGAQDVPIAWMADNDYSLCFACLPAEHERLRDEAERLRSGKPNNGFPWPSARQIADAAQCLADRRAEIAEATRINAMIEPPPAPRVMTDQEVVLHVLWSLRGDRRPSTACTGEEG